MTPLTFPQQAIVILLCAAATMLPRFLPFAVFSGKRKTPRIVRYLGAALPGAILPAQCQLAFRQPRCA